MVLIGVRRSLELGRGGAPPRFGERQRSRVQIAPGPLMDEMTPELKLAISQLANALSLAVEASLRSPRTAWVLFSGGLDSSVLAKLAGEKKPGIRLLTVGTKDSEDARFAFEIAKELGLPLDFIELNVQKIAELKERARPFSRTDMDVELAIPLLAACEFARGGLLLAGSGAEELFLGYARHRRAFERGEDLEALRRLELASLRQKDLARNEAIAAAYDVELALPYLHPLVVEAALCLPARLNFSQGRRKFFLQLAARMLGVPEAAIARPKRALQYASGVHKLLKRSVQGARSSSSGESY
ncbi:MAG: asparagine synthase-related protein [Candidatus Micrarchaeia archaeon]